MRDICMEISSMTCSIEFLKGAAIPRSVCFILALGCSGSPQPKANAVPASEPMLELAGPPMSVTEREPEPKLKHFFGYVQCPEHTEPTMTRKISPLTGKWISSTLACRQSDGTLHGPFQTLIENNMMVVGTHDHGVVLDSRTVPATAKYSVPL